MLDAAEEAKDLLQSTLDQLATVTTEEAREQALRESLEAAIAQLDADVVNALQPLTQQVTAMNNSLQTPEDQGGSPITPGEPPEEPSQPTEPGTPTP